MGKQLLALGEQAALVEQAGADTGLDRLDERAVLEPDLVVEGEQLLDLGVRDLLGEEVVEEAFRALGPQRRHGAGREVRRAGQRVDLRRGPEPVELPFDGPGPVTAGAELAPTPSRGVRGVSPRGGARTP